MIIYLDEIFLDFGVYVFQSYYLSVEIQNQQLSFILQLTILVFFMIEFPNHLSFTKSLF
jgi:hypothetical protein